MLRWNVDPELIHIGPIAIRYYSLMFVIGFFSMEKYVRHIFSKLGKNPELVSKLTVYIIVGTFLGARLAHCFFYDPEYYLKNPFDIIKVWEGGLASHGGYAGVLIAVFLFFKKYKELPFYRLMDIVSGPALFVGGLIRIGNLFNSEILGNETSMPWGVVFERVDLVVRHPVQVYESIGYFTISFILFYLFNSKYKTWAQGAVLSVAIVLSFSFRFFIELFKENESTISEGFIINMGQILSLVFVFFGFYLWRRAKLIRLNK